MTGNFNHAAGLPLPAEWAALAAHAAADVNARFGHPLMGLPGTWIGALTSAARQSPHLKPRRCLLRQTPWSEWHYWWQAQYLDAIVDTGFLTLNAGNRAAAKGELHRGQQLLRGIMIRNFGRFPNYFYDDMAWLALAAHRLNELSLRLTARPSRLAVYAIKSLTKQLHNAHDTVLGGGIYWSRKRDFKNTPANGPAALHFIRAREQDLAESILDWLRHELFDPVTGLYVDGIHPSATGRDVEHTIYTYNQGPVLAALLELGRPQHLARAADLVDCIRDQLSTPGQGLRLEPGGDGSLFTGILCRYLALAAREERLPALTRETASNLIQETAAKVRGQTPLQLSAAVQRWSILSAAAASK